MIILELVCFIPSRFVEVRQVVKLLLADHRVDPSAGEDYAVQQACANGYVEVVRLLLADLVSIHQLITTMLSGRHA